jgi:hypothetical protein
MIIKLKNNYSIREDGSGFVLMLNKGIRTPAKGDPYELIEAVCHPSTIRGAIESYARRVIADIDEETELKEYVKKYESIIKELDLGEYL